MKSKSKLIRFDSILSNIETSKLNVFMRYMRKIQRTSGLGLLLNFQIDEKELAQLLSSASESLADFSHPSYPSSFINQVKLPWCLDMFCFAYCFVSFHLADKEYVKNNAIFHALFLPESSVACKNSFLLHVLNQNYFKE